MTRRDLIALLSSTAASWPLRARAQQPERVRRIGVLVGSSKDDPEMQARLAGFRQGLESRGWSQARIHIDTLFAAGKADQFVMLAKELFAMQPDVILAHSTPVVVTLKRENRAIPIVFVSVSDPVGSGLVTSLARPGGNMTGVLQYEAGITGKWLAMLKEIAPNLTHAAFLGNPKTTNYDFFLGSAEAVAPSLAIEMVPSPVENAAEIERALETLARVPHVGVLLPPDSTTLLHRDLIVALANRYRLPAVYPFRVFVTAGGLMSYDTDQVDLFRQAAFYVDRIMRGDKAADLPVQAPTKYHTILNLKAAKALGLDVPPTLLVRADEVIE
jgi:putative ABC transport system substrate-binding protein